MCVYVCVLGAPPHFYLDYLRAIFCASKNVALPGPGQALRGLAEAWARQKYLLGASNNMLERPGSGEAPIPHHSPIIAMAFGP